MGFPGANDARETADYVLLGAPLDVSTSFQPGTRFGPREVRHHAHTFDDYDRRTEAHFTDLGVHDAGDLDAWEDAAEYLDFLQGMVTDIEGESRLPLLVGGEHTVSAAGVRATNPDVFVCLDAHLDLREEFAGNELSHATVTRRTLDVVDEVIVLGARTGSEAEWERADRDDVTVVPPEDITDWEPEFDGDAYLSVDIDAADPAFAPGTGTMEPFGLAPRELRRVVRAVAPRSVGFDVVEVNDRDDGQAAALGGKLLREFVYAHAARADD
ncbi:agmatinase [Halococcus qingdaonensis]|uniref:agmatinase n=1 Tax=Halococcus qingdaonensis TaxID=224402 RepID=UPI0021161BDE|nr:agmatinase [Halococcus qingdaonensis]